MSPRSIFTNHYGTREPPTVPFHRILSFHLFNIFSSFNLFFLVHFHSGLTRRTNIRWYRIDRLLDLTSNSIVVFSFVLFNYICFFRTKIRISFCPILFVDLTSNIFLFTIIITIFSFDDILIDASIHSIIHWLTSPLISMHVRYRYSCEITPEKRKILLDICKFV